MSMLETPEPEQTANGVSPFIAHCKSCGVDYYLATVPGQSFDQLIADTVCSCGQSDLVAKGTVDGIAQVETTAENVSTD